MANDSLGRQIRWLLEDAEKALHQGDARAARERAESALDLDPGSIAAAAFLAGMAPAANVKSPTDSQNRLVGSARTFRKKPTDAEAVLWRNLRSRQAGGAKFRRQHPIG